MFCKNCGKNIDDRAVVCPHCGVPTGNTQFISTKSNSNTVAIVGFVFSFLFALVGLICSIVGYTKAITDGRKHKGLALAGIIISAVNMILGMILTLG